MHPIERLRAVARAGAADPASAARHAAAALLGSAGHPAELVVACRRLLDRQPAAGPLWWVCSVALTATEPRAALLDVLDRLEQTGRGTRLGDHGVDDPLVIEASAIGPDGAYVPTRDAPVIEAALGVGTPVWFEAGPGVVVPPAVWEAMRRRVTALPRPAVTLVPLAGITGVMTEAGVVGPEAARPIEGFPVAPELLGGRR